MLNAFRHQRIKHPFHVIPTRSQELGAQRLSASTNQTPVVFDDHSEGEQQCSTPFGINESNTGPHGLAVVPAGKVLNAFRHQRIKHISARSLRTSSIACSTPFGINESNTFASGVSPLTDTGAQRLSASTNQTLAETATNVTSGYGAQRLSASTNQTRISLAPDPQPFNSAQRLSASTNQTLG